jgi:hypothetical protein
MIHDFTGQVFAHRGFWTAFGNQPQLPQNSHKAFERAQVFGFGLETDIRDYLGEVVISHDPVTSRDNLVVLGAISDYENEVALNIKSDGLLNILNRDDLPRDYFFFDGSIPEMQKYRTQELETAVRVSELERCQGNSTRLWIDFFENPDWVDLYLDNLEENKTYVFVSPELHNQPNLKYWTKLKPHFLRNQNLKICTDFPLEFLKVLHD